jgi:hypothetical protein
VFKHRNAAADGGIGQAEQVAYLLVGMMRLLSDQVKEWFHYHPIRSFFAVRILGVAAPAVIGQAVDPAGPDGIAVDVIRQP